MKKTQDLIEKNYRWYDKRVPNFDEVAQAHKKIMASKSKFASATVETLI